MREYAYQLGHVMLPARLDNIERPLVVDPFVQGLRVKGPHRSGYMPHAVGPLANKMSMERNRRTEEQGMRNGEVV